MGCSDDKCTVDREIGMRFRVREIKAACKDNAAGPRYRRLAIYDAGGSGPALAENKAIAWPEIIVLGVFA